jgi:hypothetical protein
VCQGFETAQKDALPMPERIWVGDEKKPDRASSRGFFLCYSRMDLGGDEKKTDGGALGIFFVHPQSQ